MGYKIGFRDEGKQESNAKEELLDYRLDQLKRMQYHNGEYLNEKEIEDFDMPTKEVEMPEKIPEPPEYKEDMEMTKAEEMKLLCEFMKVLYGYDMRLAKLEVAQKKTQNLILEQAQGITTFQLVGVVAVLFGVTFSAVALALKVMA